jgi:CRP-like cAMP-binding protein
MSIKFFFETSSIQVVMRSIYSKPWVPPPLTGQLKSFLYENGKDVIYDKGCTITQEKSYLSDILVIKSGMTSNSIVIPSSLHKPLLTFGIRFAGHISGHDTFMLRSSSPTRIVALKQTTIGRISFGHIDQYLTSHPELKTDFIRYCTQSLNSDTAAIFAMIASDIEERYWMLTASILSMLELIPQDAEWVPRPFKLYREFMASLLYVSTITIDRLYSKMFKMGKMRRNNGKYEMHIDAIIEGVRLLESYTGNYSF